MGISKQPRRVPMRPRAQIAVVDVLAQRLGSLPVIADFSRRLDIAGIIDRACPMRDIAVVSHGQVIEAQIANRRSEEHTSELQSRENLVCRLLLEKKKKINELRDLKINEGRHKSK